MNIKIIIIATLILITVGFVMFKNNGGKTMADVGTNKKVLVAYFSRTGEQYSVGNIEEGNTAIIAKIIANKTNGDLFEIKVKNDNYPKGYMELTEYAKAEKQANKRPELAQKVENIEQYDTIFIGYPNWWGDMPMPVYTFLESYDLANKDVHHFCTHEGSGGVKDGFAIYGHTAQKNRTEADKKVAEWLKSLGY